LSDSEPTDGISKQKLHSILPAAVVAIASTLPVESIAQTDHYLQFNNVGDGISIPGTASAKGFEDQVVILSWSWGVQKTIDITIQGGGQTLPNFSSVQFTKQTDSASPGIFEAMMRGTTIGEAKLTSVISGGPSGGARRTLELTLENLSVDSTSAGATASAQQAESFSLAPQRITMQFYSNDENTGDEIAGETFCWDVVKNDAC